MHNKQRKTKSPKAEIKLFNCNKNWCQVCLVINKADNFTSTVTRQSYKINHTFNCSDKFNRSDKCLICLLTSNKCLIQYVGKLQMSFNLDGTITKIILEAIIVISLASKRIYMNIIQVLVTLFNKCFSITLIDNTYSLDPLKR